MLYGTGIRLLTPHRIHITARDIDYFFAPPTVDTWTYRERRGSASVLNLLRREIQDCLIGTIVSESDVLKQVEPRRLFASAMVIFAGIDLLGKFAEGDDSVGFQAIESRFKAFARDYMGLSDDQPKTLWDVRNSLMHSFGLYNSSVNKNIVFDGTWGIPIKAVRAVTNHGGTWTVSLALLFDAFVTGIENYKVAIGRDPKLKAKFKRMFRNYALLPRP